mmetsp:Transcript_40703/g.80216  ORF Transcript_40703/g.80216 Transcript_40703/m.80216 type:complete len:88 (+) Transcript_40703:255-518(+)
MHLNSFTAITGIQTKQTTRRGVDRSEPEGETKGGKGIGRVLYSVFASRKRRRKKSNVQQSVRQSIVNTSHLHSSDHNQLRTWRQMEN